MYQRPRYPPQADCPTGRESSSLTTSVPTEGRKGQWGRAPSLFQAVPQDGWPGVSNPVTIVINAKGARCICKECPVRRSGPIGVKNNSTAIPTRKEL